MKPTNIIPVNFRPHGLTNVQLRHVTAAALAIVGMVFPESRLVVIRAIKSLSASADGVTSKPPVGADAPTIQPKGQTP